MKKIEQLLIRIVKIIRSNSKTLIKSLIAISIIALIIIISVVYNNTHTVTCTVTNTIHEGFDNKEDVEFKLSGKKLSKITYNRKVTINDFYEEYGTYIDVLGIVLKNGYKYISNPEIKKDTRSVSISFVTKKDGIILNNFTINDSQEDKTSMSFDMDSNLDKDPKAFKIGNKYTKSEMKRKLKTLGYTCK